MARMAREGRIYAIIYPRMMQESVKKNNGASFARMMRFRDGVAPMAIPRA